MQDLSHSMSNRHLGHISTAIHTVEFGPPGNKPIESVSYLLRTRTRDFEKNEIENMLLMSVIEPAQTNLALPVVVTFRTDGELLFCTDCQKPNAVTVRDFYLLPKIDEWIDSLENARVF